MEIRRQGAGERSAVREVVVAAFERVAVADLTEALQDGSAGAAGLSFVAERDGRIVGHVLLSRSWLDAPQRLVEVLVLSPLSVDPAYQGQGIGSALVRHALVQAREHGAPLLFLEGSPAYYGRFGFEAATPLGFTAPSVRIPEPGFQVVVLDSHEPWMTGALVYAEPFWVYDCVGLRAPDQ